MLRKFYCSKKINNKNQMEFHLKESKKDERKVFNSLEETIDFLKSFKSNIMMWVKNKGVFTHTVKINADEKEIKVDIVEVKPKKETDKIIKKEESVKKETSHKLNESKPCEDCVLLHNEENLTEEMLKKLENSKVIKETELTKDDVEEKPAIIKDFKTSKNDKIIKETELTKDDIEEKPAIIKDFKTEKVIIKDFSSIDDCKECELSLINPELNGIECKECIEHLNISENINGSNTLQNIDNSNKKPILKTEEKTIIPNNKIIDYSNFKEIEPNEKEFFVRVKGDNVNLENSKFYVLVDEKTKLQKLVRVSEIDNVEVLINNEMVEERKESIWTRTNYGLWFAFWFCVVALVVILIFVFI